MEYYAHSAGAGGKPQAMREHADNVATGAAGYANAFGAGEEARLAGQLHDAGKCADLFMRRLAGQESGLDHWSAGALMALARYGSAAAALAIQGHHIGLQHGDVASLREMDLRRVAARLQKEGRRLTDADADAVHARLLDQGISPERPSAYVLRPPTELASEMLDVRMLFSALVDADFLDTEAHFVAPREVGAALQPERAIGALERHMTGVSARSEASDAVRTLRADLYGACVNAADLEPGLFTLSAPTGSGKTLAMLAFALRHALKWCLRRVIVVVPYISIIDQTAAVYRDILEPVFGPEYVIEHHSLAGTRGSGGDDGVVSAVELRRRQLTENWDAPVIITTSVQMLESLFADRPSACRKLHRVARSVVLFDEVQTLPVHLAVPTLKALSRLASPRYGCSVVFATATQPAFDHLHGSALEERDGTAVNIGWQPREIVPASAQLFGRQRRVMVEWEQALVPVPWSAIADRIADAADGQVLCIANLRRHAYELARSVEEPCGDEMRHLSTNMCPAHRLDVLALVGERLKRRAACRLISTSCVEAGVDLDFPSGLRMFADLASIAQAAGRVNRHGNRPTSPLHVFTPDDPRLYPSAAYEQAAAVTAMLLRQRGPGNMDVDDPALFDAYYRLLYDLVRPDEMRRELQEAIRLQDYPEVARLYRLIPEAGVNILVPYAEQLATYEALSDEAFDRGVTPGWVRRARPLTVSTFLRRDDPVLEFLLPVPPPRGGTDEWYVCPPGDLYTQLYGLVPPRESPNWIA